MAKAWVSQPAVLMKRHGPEACPWAVEWYDPAGRRRMRTFGPGPRGKKLAERYHEKVDAELKAGTYGVKSKAAWADLVAEYEQLRHPHLSPDSRRLTANALKHFARITGLKKVAALDAAAVARYSATRLTEPGKGGVGTVKPATVNLELRQLKAVFAFAAEHGYLAAAPKVRMCKEPKRLPRVVDPDRFAELFAACDAATLPAGVPNVAAPDWWRALFTFLFMTGWRIGETMKLPWADVDLDAGEVVTRAEHNKAGRDERLPLHPAAADLLGRIRGGFTAEVFPWPHHRRTLDEQWYAIQAAAGVGKPYHGFHDFRRSFATYNAEELGAETLKRMMRQQSYATTQRYIRMAETLTGAKAKLFVPDALKGRKQG